MGDWKLKARTVVKLYRCVNTITTMGATIHGLLAVGPIRSQERISQ